MTDNNIGRGSVEVKLNTLDIKTARFKTEEFTTEVRPQQYSQPDKEVKVYLAQVSMPRAVWDELGQPQKLFISTSQ